MFTCVSFRRSAVNGSLDLARQALGHTREAMTRRYLDPRFCGKSLVGVLPRVLAQ